MPLPGVATITSEATPARIISENGPANDCTIRSRRSIIRPSEASTKNAGEPKKMKKPAPSTRRL